MSRNQEGVHQAVRDYTSTALDYQSDWIALFDSDGIPAGEFGCWKRGMQLTWCAKSPNEITPAEREAIEKRRVANEAAEGGV